MYEIWLEPEASATLEHLYKRDRGRWRRIRKRLDDLMVDPKHGAIPLQDRLFKGLERVRAGKDRIIYQICEECRADLLIQELRNCVDCDDIPENAIKVFVIDIRSSAYRRTI